MSRFISFGVRFSERGRQALSLIADYEGLSKAAAIRRLVLWEARQLGLIHQSSGFKTPVERLRLPPRQV